MKKSIRELLYLNHKDNNTNWTPEKLTLVNDLIVDEYMTMEEIYASLESELFNSDEIETFDLLLRISHKKPNLSFFICNEQIMVMSTLDMETNAPCDYSVFEIDSEITLHRNVVPTFAISYLNRIGMWPDESLSGFPDYVITEIKQNSQSMIVSSCVA
jgi:hypothetical protein